MEDLLVDSRVYHIKDERFDVNRISFYQLIIKIQRSTLALAVFDTESNLCTLFEKYRFDRFSSPENVTIFLHNIWTKHHFLNAGFWKGVKVLICTRDVAIVPSALFESGDELHYLSLNTSIDTANTELHHRNLNNAGVSVCFGVHNEIKKWFSNTYPETNLSFENQASVFLEAISNQYQPTNDDLFLLLSDDLMTAIHWKDDQLHFMNCYHISSPNDALYFLTLLAQELGLSSEESRFIFWGTLEEDNEVLPLLKKYFKHIIFGDRPGHLSFGYPFDELPRSDEFEVFSAFTE